MARADIQLYDGSGYVNVAAILSLGLPFNFICGGRGTGKTYTTLKTLLDKDITKFMLMRRTQTQCDIISNGDFSPFKAINEDCGYNVGVRKLTKNNSAYYHMEPDLDGKPVTQGAPIGYTCALTTMSSIRGFSMEDVQVLIYDEFIPERHERPIKYEGEAFLNAYETINRNREIKGKRPLQVLALANSNNLANPIFIELGLVSIVSRMRRKGWECYIDRERGIGLFMLDNSPISDAKADTSLYRLTEGSAFSAMALDNDFNEADTDLIRNRPIREYRPLVFVGELAVYEHKSNRTLYVTTHRSGNPQAVYSSSEIDLSRFRSSWSWVWMAYIRREVWFEDHLCLVLFAKYF